MKEKNYQITKHWVLNGSAKAVVFLIKDGEAGATGDTDLSLKISLLLGTSCLCVISLELA